MSCAAFATLARLYLTVRSLPNGFVCDCLRGFWVFVYGAWVCMNELGGGF